MLLKNNTLEPLFIRGFFMAILVDPKCPKCYNTCIVNNKEPK